MIVIRKKRKFEKDSATRYLLRKYKYMWIREGAAGFLCLELDQFVDQLFISPPEYPESVLSAHDLGDIYGDDWATPFEAFFPRTPLYHPSIHPSIHHTPK